MPNRALRGAAWSGEIAALAAYRHGAARGEIRRDKPHRFPVAGPGLPDAYVEVKSVTLSRQPGLAEFPDSVTARGAKHLDELANMAAEGTGP